MNTKNLSPARQRLAQLLVVAVLTLVACTAAACQDTTAPRAELPCSNSVTPPDRFAVPHRYKDSIPLFGDKGTSLDGQLLGYLVYGDPVEKQRCLTLADSLWLFSGQRPKPAP